VVGKVNHFIGEFKEEENKQLFSCNDTVTNVTMSTHSVKKQPKSTVEILVKLTWATYKKPYKHSFATLHATV